MEIFTQIITYFGVPLISSADTFPQLLEYLLTTFCSMYVILIMFKTIFRFMSQVNRMMEK